MKRILCLLCGCLLFVVGNAQASLNNKVSDDSTVVPNEDYFKTHFLWFTGHWQSKSLFVTTTHTEFDSIGAITIGGGGSSLTIGNNDEVRLSSPQTDKWNKRIEDGLNQLQKFESELQAPANTANEWGNHFEKVVQPELNDLKREWKAEKIDTKTNILSPESKEQQEANALQKFAANLTTWCNETKAKYDAIISFYKTHKKDKDADLYNPAPPEIEDECMACDTAIDKRNKQKDSAYVAIFFKPEADLLRDALSIERNLMFLGYGTDFTGYTENVPMDAQMADKIGQAFSKKQNGACAYIDNYELNEAIQFLAMRMYWRAKKLFKDYRNNIKTAEVVIKTLLSAIKANVLMGFTVSQDNDLAECAGLLGKVLDYYEGKLFHEHDWSQLANIPFLISLERNKQLLGATESDLLLQLQKLLNSFHLQIEMDVKSGKEGKGYAIVHLKGETKIAPEFNYVNDTCYRWVVVDGVDNIGLPQKKSSQKIECDLITNEIVAPGPRPEYIGTKKYYTLLNGLKMDYCHPGKDTILLSSFIAEPNPNAGTWRYPGGAIIANGTMQLEHFFQSIDTLEALAKSGRAEEQAEKMKEQGMQIAAQMKAIQAQMGNKKDASNLENLHKIQDLATKAFSLGNNQNSAPILSIDFPLQIQNNNTTLQDKRYDAKEINPQEAPAIIYAYYTIKVVYEVQK